MRKLRNTNPNPALTPEPCGTKPPDEYTRLANELTLYREQCRQVRQTLRAERKRNGSVEAVLTRYIATLERQVNDLRSAYFANIQMTTAPNPNPKAGKL